MNDVPPNGNGANQGPGVNPRMAEFAEVIDRILGAHAGGWNRPCPVALGDQQGAITPIQAVVNLTAALSDFTEEIHAHRKTMHDHMEAIEENTDAAYDDEEDNEPVRKKGRR